MITQNRDKINGVVNGQLAYVHTVHNHSVYLKLPNDKVVAIYQVTMKINETLLQGEVKLLIKLLCGLILT